MFVLFPGYGPEIPDAPVGLNTEIWVKYCQSQVKDRGLISSPQIDRGYAIKKVLSWLELAGMDVKKEAAKFSIFIWPNDWKGYKHAAQKVKRLIEAKEEFIDISFKRSPRFIIFLSCYMLEAVNDPEIISRLEPVFGEPCEKPRRITSTRLKVQAQRWERTLMLALPIPGTNTTEEFVKDLVTGLKGLG